MADQPRDSGPSESGRREQAEAPSWGMLHDVAFLYLFLAAETDKALSDTELKTVIERLHAKVPSRSLRELQTVVQEAAEAARPRAGRKRAYRVIESLKYAALSDEQRSDLLNDLLQIARADGTVHQNEIAFLRALAKVWGIELPGVLSSEAHDLALIFLFMALGTDHTLDSRELDAVADELRQWKPNLSTDKVQALIKEAVRKLQQEDHPQEVQQAIDALKQAVPDPARRRAILEGVMRIAKADGVLHPSELSFFKQLSEHLELP